MGTEITLDVGGVSITYSKNHRGTDHGSLFQEQDRKPIKSDQINYDYYESEGEDRTLAEIAFVRPLKDVLPRLELLGFNLDRVRREYEYVTERWREDRQDTETLPELMTFEDFRQFATFYPLDSLDDTFVSCTDEGDERKIRGRFAEMVADRIPYYRSYKGAKRKGAAASEWRSRLHVYLRMRLTPAQSKG